MSTKDYIKSQLPIIANALTAADRIRRLAAVIGTTPEDTITAAFGDEATGKQVSNMLLDSTLPVEQMMPLQLAAIAKHYDIPAWVLTRKREAMITYITNTLPKLTIDDVVRLAAKVVEAEADNT